VDTTQATASNRLKLYVNGDSVTEFSSGNNTYPTTQDFDTPINSTSFPLAVGAYDTGTVDPFDGYMAEVHFIDGLSFFSDTSGTANPSFNIDSFGETKEGIWIPKEYTGSHGTNGFYLNFTDDTTAAGFSSVAYEGNSSTQSITGVGFQPDFVWVKNRQTTYHHALVDVVRGATKSLSTSLRTTESSVERTSDITSLDSDGFSLQFVNATGSFSENQGSQKYISWNWQAGGTPTTDNSAGQGNVPTAGSVKINGSNSSSALSGSLVAKKISANTTYGFSIVKWTGVGTAANTIDHGLGVAPKFIITKHINDSTYNWNCFHQGLDASSPEDFFIGINPNTAGSPSGRGGISAANTWNQTLPTTSVFSVNSEASAGENGEDMIAYCFAEISGYSSIGSYTGNGSSTGPTVTTGFDVGWLLVKKTHTVSSGATASGTSWIVLDRSRDPGTEGRTPLFAGESAAEVDSPSVTFTSTGFQIATVSGSLNTNGANYIYVAIKNTRTNAFFRDQSGNGNHFSPTGLEYTDSMPDLPTNNWCVLNNNLGLFDSQITYQAGNTEFDQAASTGNAGHMNTQSTFGFSSGKWYWEVFASSNQQLGFSIGMSEEGSHFPSINGRYNIDGSFAASGCTAPSSGASRSSTDVIGFAFDADNGTLAAYKNNSLQGTFTSIPTGNEYFARTFVNSSSASGGATFNFGQDSSFGNRKTAGGNTDQNGIGDFFYAPPAGFLALCTNNLPNPSIDPNRGDDPADYFNTVLYTGNDGTQSITGAGFSPDFVWIKNRTDSNQSHYLFDTVRGADKALFSDAANAETDYTSTGRMSSFDADGFTVKFNSSTGTNDDDHSYVSWLWKAGGTAVSNGNGSITSSVSANTEAGFSVVGYTGTGSSFTVGHGLSSAPEMVIFKDRDSSVNWIVYHKDYANSQYIQKLNLPDEQQDAGSGYALTRGSSTLGILDGIGINKLGSDHIAYCFHSVEGYSKIGVYEGNASAANGPYVHTGFRPAFIIFKNMDSSQNWFMFDSERSPYNEVNGFLRPNTNDDEFAFGNGGIDILANGFKIRGDSTLSNGVNNTHIYIAFAKQPFKYANAT
jgi:hypothetical protein